MKTIFMSLFCLVIISLISLVSCNESKSGNKGGTNSTNSQVANDSIFTGDSLELWIAEKKKESQFYRNLGNYDSARIVLDVCINTIPRSPETDAEFKLLGWVYVNRAYLFGQVMGDYLRAKEDYLNALDQFQQGNYEDFLVARFALQPLGNIYTRLGENEQAIVMLTRFQRICEENGEEDALVNSYNDLGRAYTNKSDYIKAIQVLNTGIERGQKDYFNRGLLYSSLAEAYLNLEKFEKGIEAGKRSRFNFEKAKSTVEDSNYKFDWIEKYLIGTEMILAELNIESKNYDQGNTLYANALVRAEKLYQTKHRKIAKIYLGLAKCYSASGDLEKGIGAYQKTLTSVIPKFNEEYVGENPDIESLYAEITIGEALIGKARVAKQLFEKTEAFKWLKLSLETYTKYFEWEDLFRAEQQDIRSKLLFTSEIHQVGEEVLAVLCLLQTLEGGNNYSQKAFKIIEQTKGILLSESRADLLKNAKLIQQNPAFKLLNEQKMQLSLLRIELNQSKLTNDSSNIETHTKKIEDLVQEQQLTLFEVKKQFPQHDQLLYQRNDTIDMVALKEYIISSKTDVLNYFVGKNKSFLVTGHRETFQLYELNREKGSTDDFLSQLYHPEQSNADDYQEKALAMFNNLLAPASPSLTSKKWIVLPDAELNKVPFEALVTQKKSGAVDFRNLKYLLHSHSISYAPSAKFILKKESNKEGLKSYLGVAPIFKQNSMYPWLKNSEAEIQIGEEIFGGKQITGANASKKAFLKEIEDYRIVHISTHAGVDSDANDNNWMAFHSPSAKKKSHLITSELFQLKLSSDLIVLNACETASGKFYEGEGMLSMCRGFLYAGADNVITNLWQVNHEANAVILKNFYEELGERKTPSIALRQAKIDYLKSEDTDAFGAHPYYWSAPILIGTNNELTLEIPSNYSILLYSVLIACLLLISSLIFIRRRRKRAL